MMSADWKIVIDPARFIDCWFLTGPTASGKTAIGVALAERVGGEIISLDSMALYRGMDVGTAKPSAAERRCVPHHLIDVVDPRQEFSVAQYLTASARLVEEIRARRHEPIFVGGTPLYLKALLRGLSEGPPADWELRRRLLAEAQSAGCEALHARLAAVDPASAARLHANDVRRVVRALEVHELTGRPISAWQAEADWTPAAPARRVFALDWPREALAARINQRVDAMIEAGLVDEARRLRERGELSRTASQAVGYAEIFSYLNGECELAMAIEKIKARTRQFAKRQRTWFRSLAECRFVPMSAPVDVAQVAATVARLGEESDEAR